MKLYNYFRSSASFRVRIALEVKGLPYDYLPVHLVKAEHLAPGYADRVGDTLVPALQTDDGHLLTQSMAIIEYLDETHREPALLPGDALARARVRALAQMVACEIHPLNNLRVLKYLKHQLQVEDAAKKPQQGSKKKSQPKEEHKEKRAATTEAGRVGNRPYARGRAYSEKHYDE